MEIVTSADLLGRPASAPAQGTERWEYLRALGSVALTSPPRSRPVWQALGLSAPTGAEYTRVFVLWAPPHAAIHLGPEGKLGGVGLDRVGGFWRALQLRAPEDADHLGALLMLYAELGTAERTTDDETRAAQLRHSRHALLHEHIWSWAPGYLAAVNLLGVRPLGRWAELTLQALRAEHESADLPTALPLALREAPEPLVATGSFDEALDALVSPVRTGMVLTQRDLHEGARVADVGFRRGERRFALRAMMQQDPIATLRWLLQHTRQWTDVHARCGDDPTNTWWRKRSQHAVRVLEQMLSEEQA